MDPKPTGDNPNKFIYTDGIRTRTQINGSTKNIVNLNDSDQLYISSTSTQTYIEAKLTCSIKVGDDYILNVRNEDTYGTGRVGINISVPHFPLHVSGYALQSSMPATAYYSKTATSATWTASQASSRNISAKFENQIWINANYLFISSDSRIKTNIVDVPDNLALQQFRSIPCRYYEYIDKISSGTDKTIGFIAQEVKSVFPMAVTQQKQIIPDVYKTINCTWTSINGKFSMSSSDLPNVSGIIYKFYVSNASDGSDEKEIILTGNSDNTFTFDSQYTNVFCYGSEVDDFNILDKQKLFTLNFSATQEIDRIQQTHITEIASLKAENTELKTKLNELTNKIKNATTFEDLKNSL